MQLVGSLQKKPYASRAASMRARKNMLLSPDYISSKRAHCYRETHLRAKDCDSI